jgi:hypothetical protein
MNRLDPFSGPPRACRLAAGLLAFVAIAAPGDFAGAAALPAAGPAELAPCRLDGLPMEALCGVVRRPLNPAVTGGPTIDVHYAVIPALARNKKPDPVLDRKSTRLNSSHNPASRMPSSA